MCDASGGVFGTGSGQRPEISDSIAGNMGETVGFRHVGLFAEAFPKLGNGR